MTHYLTPEINSYFNSLSNMSGKVKFSQDFLGAIADVVVQVPQVCLEYIFVIMDIYF